MKKFIVPVLGLLFSFTARADGPTLEDRVTRLENEVAAIKQAVALKPATKGDVVVSFGAYYVAGGGCLSYQTVPRSTKESELAKVLKVIDCSKVKDIATFYQRTFYLVQFADGSLGTFLDKDVTTL